MCVIKHTKKKKTIKNPLLGYDNAHGEMDVNCYVKIIEGSYFFFKDLHPKQKKKRGSFYAHGAFFAKMSITIVQINNVRMQRLENKWTCPKENTPALKLLPLME